MLAQIFFSMLVLCCVTACNTTSNKNAGQKTSDDFYLASGVARYFMPNIPAWANRSESAGCLREDNYYRFDMKALRQSYGLSYADAVQFQLSFNHSSREALERAQQAALPLKEMETLFHLTMDRIRSQIYVLSIPNFERIHLIWIDPAMKDAKALQDLKNLMNSEAMDLGHPVFVSLCHNYNKVQTFMSAQRFLDSNIRIFSAEIFHPFDPEMNLLAFDRLFIDQVFTAKQKIYFYSPTPQAPPELHGNREIKNY